MSKEDILNHINQNDIKNKWKVILDQADQVTRKHNVKKTAFLSPGEWGYAESVLCRYKDIKWISEGGYEDAERKRLILFPDYIDYEEIEKSVALLKVNHKLKSGELTHRDYLGALLSLGIDREIIGDIIVGEGVAYIITTPEMKDYIKLNLDTVGAIKVVIDETDSLPDEITSTTMNILSGTVASLRIDSVISMALKLSRQKSQVLIDAQKVKVNWIPVQKSMVLLKEQDLVSVSGFGRFKLLNIGNMSRSNRFHIEVGKMK